VSVDVLFGRFVEEDVLYPWTFCIYGRFVERMFCREGRYVEGRFVDGRFVEGRFVEGRFVLAPINTVCIQKEGAGTDIVKLWV
jgi:hypothetical protein